MTPWISESSLILKQKISKLQKKFVRDKSLITYNNLLDCKRDFKKNIRSDKEKYYLDKLKEANNNSRAIWMVINEILNRNKKGNKLISKIIYKNQTLTEPSEIAEGFNQYYKNIAFDLAMKIPDSKFSAEHYLSMTPRPKKEFVLKEISEFDIIREIQSFKNKQSSGFDGMSNKMLKIIVPYITAPLKYAVNKSFKESTFPPQLKISKLTPLYKKDDPTQCGNFRPIANVSSWSKLYEKLIMSQIKKFHKEENILPINQMGFRSGHSTYHALILTLYKIQTELFSNNFCILLSLDLSKCFDTLDINTILSLKFNHFYQNPKTIQFLLSFFKGRSQYVRVNSTDSQLTKNYDISCVQGSTMGPTTYSLYSSDIENITDQYLILFADDSNIILYNHCFEQAIKTANDTLSIINDYMAANKLTLNAKKTKAMLFCPRNKKALPLNLKIGDSQIEQVKELVFLGVKIDHNLTFKSHFEKVVTKVKQGLSALTQVKNFLSYRSKLMIYHGLIHCHLSYCPLIWLKNQPQKNIHILENIQKKAIRAIFSTKYNAHTEDLFILSNIVKIENICLNDELKLMHNYIKGSIPIPIYDIIKITEGKIRPRMRRKSRNIKTFKNTGNIAFDLIHNWQKFDLSLSDKKDKHKYSHSTIKNMIKLYLQKKSSRECLVENCFSCPKTPTIKRLKNYMTSPL